MTNLGMSILDDLIAIKKSITDMDLAFSNFQKAEADSWRLYGIPPRKEYLVKASGSLTSYLSHRKNQPSFTTHFPKNSIIVDSTNPCISMIMGTAYNTDSLLYD
jgi:hypothetical protein